MLRDRDESEIVKDITKNFGFEREWTERGDKNAYMAAMDTIAEYFSSAQKELNQTWYNENNVNRVLKEYKALFSQLQEESNKLDTNGTVDFPWRAHDHSEHIQRLATRINKEEQYVIENQQLMDAYFKFVGYDRCGGYIRPIASNSGKISWWEWPEFTESANGMKLADVLKTMPRGSYTIDYTKCKNPQYRQLQRKHVVT